MFTLEELREMMVDELNANIHDLRDDPRRLRRELDTKEEVLKSFEKIGCEIVDFRWMACRYEKIMTALASRKLVISTRKGRIKTELGACRAHQEYWLVEKNSEIECLLWNTQ